MMLGTRKETLRVCRCEMMELWIMMVQLRVFIKHDSSINYTQFLALYEDESDDGLSMESHGSVVTHLLSQVKIGMDLTKVVLPTFILERRSLLEMYADYFAHPDLFLRCFYLSNSN